MYKLILFQGFVFPLGAIYEGFRYTQRYLAISFYVASIINFVQVFMLETKPTLHVDAMFFYAAGTLYYGYLRYLYGELNFDSTYVTGPYEVGCTTMATPRGNFCVVYYPIDKEKGFLTGISQHLSYHAPGGPTSER